MFHVTARMPLSRLRWGLALAGFLADRLARTLRYNRTAAVVLSVTAFYISLPDLHPQQLVRVLGQLSSTTIFLGLVVAIVTGEFVRRLTRIFRPPALGIAAAHDVTDSAAVLHRVTTGAATTEGEVTMTDQKRVVTIAGLPPSPNQPGMP